MIRSLLGWLLSITKRLVDDTIPEEDLHTYLRRGLLKLNQRIDAGDISVDHEFIPLIAQNVVRLQRHDFPDIPPFAKATDKRSGEGDLGDTGSTEPVVRNGVIEGRVVEDLSLAVDHEKPFNEQQMTQMEVLLRHIEVRRKTALRFEDFRSEEERWSSAARISSLFSRYAKREMDFRFLNSALKLNDWAYRFYHSRINQTGNSQYLLAVLEAEATLLEMTT